jgi:protein-L-isoaspartate(D-aspartate) O-methyltransferase
MAYDVSRPSRVAGAAPWLLAGAACLGASGTQTAPVQPHTSSAAHDQALAASREAMVARQIAARGVRDEAVLAAMRKVPRHLFVPAAVVANAYDDTPLPIGRSQTISQPYIVAYMSETLRVTRAHKVLEVGTGSGYQAAVLGELARAVYTIEIIPELGERARTVLEQLEYSNVHVRIGDGYLGWPDEAPFDRIMVTAAPDHVPQPLIDQLAVGGIMVLPVGTWHQEIVVLSKTPAGVVERRTIPVRFVPLTRSPRSE